MTAKGLRQFLDDEQQRAWLDGETAPHDGDRSDFHETLEQRFKYAARFEKLLQRPQAPDVIDILRTYAATCIPIPRTTERFYWSVSCLPGSPDKPLVRISASFMELFALHADLSARAQGEDREAIVEQRGERAKAGRQVGKAEPDRRHGIHSRDGLSVAPGSGLRARFILHLSDFTADGSPETDQFDQSLLEQCVDRPEDIGHSIWRNGKGILIAKVRGAASIRAFLEHPHALRAIRRFNLTHMNRGRNAYQASHCYSLADVMLED